MAKVYLDANYFIGLANRVPEIDALVLDDHELLISTLSCHILGYVNKIKLPDKALSSLLKDFTMVGLDEKILKMALEGPTFDLEDNIQLHSAAGAESNYFLTFDKQLLRLKFFGKTRIVSKLPT